MCYFSCVDFLMDVFLTLLIFCWIWENLVLSLSLACASVLSMEASLLGTLQVFCPADLQFVMAKHRCWLGLAGFWFGLHTCIRSCPPSTYSCLSQRNYYPQLGMHYLFNKCSIAQWPYQERTHFETYNLLVVSNFERQGSVTDTQHFQPIGWCHNLSMYSPPSLSLIMHRQPILCRVTVRTLLN